MRQYSRQDGGKMATNNDKDKQAALDIALAHIEKDYGKGAVMRLGEAAQRLATEVIPTGSLALDVALGAGGIPRGRVSEIFGAESTGKSTLAIHIMTETQKLGGACRLYRRGTRHGPSLCRTLRPERGKPAHRPTG